MTAAAPIPAAHDAPPSPSGGAPENVAGAPPAAPAAPAGGGGGGGRDATADVLRFVAELQERVGALEGADAEVSEQERAEAEAARAADAASAPVRRAPSLLPFPW